MAVVYFVWKGFEGDVFAKIPTSEVRVVSGGAAAVMGAMGAQGAVGRVAMGLTVMTAGATVRIPVTLDEERAQMFADLTLDDIDQDVTWTHTHGTPVWVRTVGRPQRKV